MSKEAMKLALETLETIAGAMPFPVGKSAITALREALAEQPAQQEPVAYLCENAVGHKYFRWKKPSSEYKPIALYTSPLAQRKPLTDEQWQIIADTLGCFITRGQKDIIEAALRIKEKNT